MTPNTPKKSRHSDDQSWAEEEAKNLAKELNMCCKHSRKTRCFQCSMKLIATALRSARNRGLEEAVEEVQNVFNHQPTPLAEGIIKRIRALREVL